MHGNHACCQNDLGGDYNRIEQTHLAEVDLESVFLKFSPSSSNATARGLASYGRIPHLSFARNGNMGTFLAPPAFLFSPEAREVEEHRETLYKTLSVVYAMPHLQNCGWHVPLRYRPSNMTRSALCECHNSLAKGQ